MSKRCLCKFFWRGTTRCHTPKKVMMRIDFEPDEEDEGEN